MFLSPPTANYLIYCVPCRFPCSRTTGLDPFREGDFDLPYRMKMLDRVSIYMNYFFTLPYFSDAVKDANCLDPHLITPLRNGRILKNTCATE